MKSLFLAFLCLWSVWSWGAEPDNYFTIQETLFLRGDSITSIDYEHQRIYFQNRGPMFYTGVIQMSKNWVFQNCQVFYRRTALGHDVNSYIQSMALLPGVEVVGRRQYTLAGSLYIVTMSKSSPSFFIIKEVKLN